MAEHALTREHLTKLFSEPLEERRPRWKTLKAREVPLQKLHRQQVGFWSKSRRSNRNHSHQSLLLVINAIASGLRTTG